MHILRLMTMGNGWHCQDWLSRLTACKDSSIYYREGLGECQVMLGNVDIDIKFVPNFRRSGNFNLEVLEFIFRVFLFIFKNILTF